ncbi:hypothetical protein [Pseudarthrobacter sp. NamE5]|uniref:hypothetical protein n=1 Tax=Pseudarthrobacter sp. NamE5 TaxID=2576839 RepID=UPI00116F420E|nr:hypothetical protein [Pseudarthrobacter sp. NamE5]TLM80859.1 hypothetical protein FDW84_18625 [Pseudarthrobacter sp. NamE5]
MKADRFDQAVSLCLFLAAVAIVGGMLDFILVWDDFVMPGWALSASLLVLSLGLAIVGAFVRHPRKAASGEQGSNRRGSGLRAGLAFLVGVCSVIGGVGDLGATYTVLRPQGPGFCQAAVREHSFLFAGGGELYAVGFGGFGMPVSSWTADDGYQPVASGTYEFTWDNEVALLMVHGSVDPVWPTLHDFKCRAES